MPNHPTTTADSSSGPLTPARLFSDPPLQPALPQRASFIPGTEELVYLQSSSERKDELELMRSDGKKAHCWLNAKQLERTADDNNQTELTAAEKAERERRRLFMQGITDFYFSRDGQLLLIPWNGRAFVFRTATTLDEPVYISPASRRQTDMRLSPRGSYLSYILDADLYFVELATGKETRVTTDGSDTVTNGRADFIAQEEMHRFDGHWWSPTESCLAYQRTDSAKVIETYRHEIEAASINVISQRYPYAGADNALVQLAVLEVNTGVTRWMDYAEDPEDYLARVHWFGDKLTVQVQSRNQQQLTLKRCDPLSAEHNWTVLQSETSETWINLHENFSPLEDGRFVWTSEGSGTSTAYLVNPQTEAPPQQLTPSGYYVAQVLKCTADRLWFTGWHQAPTEQHLYSQSLEEPAQAPQRHTQTPGWHEVKVSDGATAFVDQFSSLDSAPELSLCSLSADGSRSIAATALADSPYARYLPQHCPSILGELSAEDGQTLHYRLTAPQDTSTPRPAVVYVYGGPGVFRVKNELPSFLLQLFAQRGIAVLELDNRGSSHRGPAFEAPIYRAMGSVEVVDQVRGVEMLNTLPWIDAERIGVFGHSYGGYMTLMCLAQAPDVFSAGVSVAPVADWALYDTHYTERYMGTPSNNAQGYAQSAVIPHLKDLRGRLLLMHGMADDNVLFSHCTALMHELQRLGTPFELMTYPGSKHALQETAVSIHRFELILDFFQRAFGTVPA